MRDRVDDPCRVKSDDGTEEDPPEYEAKSTYSEQRDSDDQRCQKMVLCQPDVKVVLRQIRGIAFEYCNILAQSGAKKDPTRMGPPLAIARRVRIAFLVGELMMLTMDGHPQERAAFQSRDAANREEVLKPFGCRVRAMGEQSVITNPESQAPCYPIQKERDEQRMPSEEEECHDCANVKQHQDRRDLPVQSILAGLIVLHIIDLQNGCSGHSLRISYWRPEDI